MRETVFVTLFSECLSLLGKASERIYFETSGMCELLLHNELLVNMVLNRFF